MSSERCNSVKKFIKRDCIDLALRCALSWRDLEKSKTKSREPISVSRDRQKAKHHRERGYAPGYRQALSCFLKEAREREVQILSGRAFQKVGSSKAKL